MPASAWTFPRRCSSRARETNADVEGVSFVVDRDRGRFVDGSFDLVYSNIVLQHVPDRRAIESYIAEFCRIVRPGGLVAFQLPSHIPVIYRLQWQRRPYSGLRRPRRQRSVPVSAPAPGADDDELYPRTGHRSAIDLPEHTSPGRRDGTRRGEWGVEAQHLLRNALSCHATNMEPFLRLTQSRQSAERRGEVERTLG